jgi:predicted phosphohydrolase
MKQILWGTDLHYNFLKHGKIRDFHGLVNEQIKESHANALLNGEDLTTLAVVISGDISEAPALKGHLEMIRGGLGLPVYFVCGNHDYWHKSFAETRAMLTEMTNETATKWLGAVSFIPLTDTTAIVGHDGWYDAVHGDWENSRFMMNDWFYTEEFKGKTVKQVVDYCRSDLATPGADHVKKGMRDAIEKGFKNLLVVTHVPPFKDCSMYNGRPGEETSVCWYTSAIMGDALYEVASENPDIEITVLCGHTHNGIVRQILPNMTVYVGQAAYSHPRYEFVGITE